jgi:hypothetical protein
MNDTADTLLDEMVARRAAAEAAEAELLALAVRYVHLHPVTEQHPAATVSRGRATAADPDAIIVDVKTGEILQAPLAGAGTPGVALFALEQLGAVLGISYLTAWQLAGDAVELAHRLPSLWQLVMAGTVPTWRARQVARITTSLSSEAVDFVDRQVSILGAKRRMPGPAALRDLVHEAVLRHDDADRDTGLEEAALAARGVWFAHHESTATHATTEMTATLDSWDALVLDDTLSDLANTLGRLGNTASLDVRRADALVQLTDPQRTLELTDAPSSSGAATATRTRGSSVTLFAHLSLAELARIASGPGPDGHALVEQLGTASLEVVSRWLGRTERITVRPVIAPVITDGALRALLDSSATRPVDQHDPPDAMRELVILRDGACSFPGCQVDARSCDLDHVVAYQDPDDGGPPGQTHPGNLACLCRRHHRLKTFTDWDYRPTGDGSYRWTSPTGRTLTSATTPRRGPLP